MTASGSTTAVLQQIDHLIYGTPDLAATVDELESLVGLRASSGGQHMGEGTHNALYSLGAGTYLEIMAPDPRQPDPNRPRWRGIDDLTEPRLIAWVAKQANLDRVAATAASQGIDLGAVLTGGRTRPDGSTLAWQVTDPHVTIADGIVPFFIDWGDSPHPSADAVQGLTLRGLRAEHPDPISSQEVLHKLNLQLQVTTGSEPALIATIESPRGSIELR